MKILTPPFARKYLRFLSGRRALRSLPLFLALTLFSKCSWSQTLVIKRVTVIDATGGSPQPEMTVIVNGDRIVAMGRWNTLHIPRKAVGDLPRQSHRRWSRSRLARLHCCRR